MDVTIATLATPRPGPGGTALLARSLRDFGGGLAGVPIVALDPGATTDAAARGCLASLGVEIVAFEVAPMLRRFPFAAKVAAAARAERVAATPLVAWLDPDTIVLREPSQFLIPDGVDLGYRPVHHRNIGSRWEEPPDGFWTLILTACRVPEQRIVPMTTHTGEQIRPYLNAGSFVVRRARRLLTGWDAAFAALSRDPRITPWYDRSDAYAVFLHQAVFTAVVLGELEPGEMVEMGPDVNYPLHLHDEIPPGLRPGSLDALTTVRTEDLLADERWPERVPLLAPLREWVESAR